MVPADDATENRATENRATERSSSGRRPSVLVISYSTLESDARLLRQIRLTTT
jgi:hypothetical protein